MDRPSFEEIYMQMAKLISRRSTCVRLHVGTVITSTDFRKILSLGYNGNASGLHNGCDSTEPGKCGCLHSEENAVINCDVPRSTGKLVFVTDLPCVMCAKRLINLGGVEHIYFNRTYRITDSFGLLAQAKIPITQLIFSEDDHLVMTEQKVSVQFERAVPVGVK